MERDKILPIDRGWAWVVVLAASGLFALHAGGFKVQGVILVELFEKYEDVYSTSTIIWIFTVKYVIVGMIGPLVSILISKLTHRVVAFVGILLVVLSYVGLAYSYDLVTMLVFHSIPGGIGNGFVVLCALLVSGQYFKNRKALALGLIASGSGIGTLTIPYILRPLFDNMGFHGACLLYGGFCMQFLILALLLRPISYYEKIHKKELAAIAKNERESDNALVSPDVANPDVTTSDLQVDNGDSRIRSISFSHQLNPNSKGSALYSSESHLQKPRVSKNLVADKHRTEHMLSIGDLAGSVFFLESIHDVNGVSQHEEVPRVNHDRFNWRVILMPEFLMIGFSVFVYAFGTCMIYQGIPSLSKDSGVPKNIVAVVIMAGGCLEIPCRIANGYLADKKIMTATVQYTLCLFIAGFMTMLCAIITGLPGVALALIGMSTVGTSIFSLIPIVFVELIGVENVSTGMAMQLTFQSSAFLISSYIIGRIYDYTNSWQIVYYYIASMMMLASCLTWPYCFYMLCRKITCGVNKPKIISEQEKEEMTSLPTSVNN